MTAPDDTLIYPSEAALPKVDKGLDEDIIFTPLRFRNLEVKNRVFRSNISGRFDNEDGSLTQTRINWECKFAKGGVGAIISSYVPVLMEGRIIAGYATMHRDDFIPLWEILGKAIHSLATPAGRWTFPVSTTSTAHPPVRPRNRNPCTAFCAARWAWGRSSG
jgi:hypothetical protein